MVIVVNHLTRMQPGFICVAGLDVETGRHVRPVLQWGCLPVQLLARQGGPFEMGALVDLGGVTPHTQLPSVEDAVFSPAAARAVGAEDTRRFFQRLRSCARPRLRELFGLSLHPQARGCALENGWGIASLGCLCGARVRGPYLSHEGKPRLDVSDGELDVTLTITDLRLCPGDCSTPEPAKVDELRRRIEIGAEVILSVGLSRAWQKPGEDVPRHWLQVNNVHLEGDPVWRFA
jgi:hypothetical protein